MDNDDSTHRFRTSLTTALPDLSPATQSIHADDVLNNLDDVSPPIHLSTTYRYPRNHENLRPHHTRPSYPLLDGGEHCYSRQSHPGMMRVEAVLSSLLGGGQCVAYASGLAAFHALLTMLRPKRVAIGAGYHGCHGTLELYARTAFGSVEILPLDCPTEELGEGDLIHLETPVNPTGRVLSIAHYAEKAHKRGAWLSVDSTFAPPPLQEPFELGADLVMHSLTKYVGGHSDFLGGVLVVKKDDERGWFQRLHQDRLFLGSALAGFESWLALRSVRTLEMRVLRQSQSAEFIVRALHSAVSGRVQASAEPSRQPLNEDIRTIREVVKEVQHASTQAEADPGGTGWLRKQMPRGYGPVFALTLRKTEYARELPSRLLLFHHATSLGGVESLIEWRTMTDSTVTQDILRVSIGVEDPQDLLADLIQAMRAVVSTGSAGRAIAAKL